MAVKRFIDTNILLYARDHSEAAKQPIAAALMRELWETRTGRISIQVLNEYFVNITQKLKPGLTRAEAWSDIDALLEWNPKSIDTDLIKTGFKITDRYKLSWWDSLIVAAAVALACDEILSEDLTAGQFYEGIPVVNPFAVSMD